MNTLSVPRKCIGLHQLPVKDGKLRRLFIIADGQRSIAEIIKHALIGEEEGLKLVQQLIDNNYLGVDDAEAGAAQPVEVDSTDSQEFLNTVTEELAKFVGPYAMVAMEPHNSFTRLDSQEQRAQVVQAALAELDSDQDKNQFLDSLKKAGCLS